MQRITVTFGGVPYSGLPLTLDALEEVRKAPAGNFDIAVVRAFLADEATEPKAPDKPRAFPGELADAVRAILALSEMTLGEAPAGAV
jgi:hypothetical protein